ncbi:hypothetical protein A8F94_12555 [Bacillus sp. FJAT-27225]|uniref:hypothetical protein n=1 Tax=Bacillus sp. FJAT-27225 TaxID=1743144 RepID=UPI00080C2E28|nr:hypothetical protein [Bacillus sp. FJAT-27225]OCA85700.1 hypothetical protein A8F94_12555 [Bacillus sp. FJAT-27225]
MRIKKEKGTLDKVPISINLEEWIWETVDRIQANRTQFFRELFLEKMKKELLHAKLIGENDQMTEAFADYYRILCQQKRRKLPVRLDRSRVRSRNAGENVPASIKKKPVSLNLESWIWELISNLDPNRSAYFRRLFLAKVKNDLVSAGVIRGDAVIGKIHGDLYCQYFGPGDTKPEHGKLG